MSEYIVRMPQDMPYEIKVELNAWYINSEPIVRCRDCKHLNKLSRKYEDYECCLTYMDVTLNGFCAWGERRSDE